MRVARKRTTEIMLTMEVEYLTGVAFAARVDRPAEAEWPPHPDRLFSALVAAWAETGAEDNGRAALEWLETQAAPQIIAPEAAAREVVDVFVPPNDAQVSGKVGGKLPKDWKAALYALPSARTNRQPRQFPASVIEWNGSGRAKPVWFVWPAAEPTPTVEHALASIAHNVAYLGHSSALVRVTVDTADGMDGLTHWPDDTGDVQLRWVYPRRLEDLVRDFDDTLAFNLKRKRGQPSRTFRPQPGPAVRYATKQTKAEPPRSVFGHDWIVFEDAGGAVPALTALAHLSRTVHRSLLSHAGDGAPEVLSGHQADGAPSTEPHVAIVPLADVGSRYATGRLMGFAVVLPRDLERHYDNPDRKAVLQAVAKLAISDDNQDGGLLRLSRTVAWQVRRVPFPDKWSLQSDRYLGPRQGAKRWATITPLLLDRHPKAGGEGSAEIVMRACENIGLPAPADVLLTKHSAVNGAPSAWPPGGAPKQTDWSFPKDSPLAARRRVHATLTFEEPVHGPIILGAGRFRGFGLCLPLRDDNR